jgi:hypothetical protein
MTMTIAAVAVVVATCAISVAVKTANSVNLHVTDAADSLDRLSDILKRRK